MEFGLPVFQPQKKRVKSMSGAEYHAAARGESWKFRLMNTIDECMRYARSREELRRPSLEWLLVPVVLLGLLALWYGWAALWNGLTTLFP